MGRLNDSLLREIVATRALGATQQDIAKDLNVSQQTVSRYLKQLRTETTGLSPDARRQRLAELLPAGVAAALVAVNPLVGTVAAAAFAAYAKISNAKDSRSATKDQTEDRS